MERTADWLEDAAEQVAEYAWKVAKGDKAGRRELYRKVGLPLDLVDDDEPRQVFQGKLRLFQTGKILGIFQIEIGIGGKRSGQRRFSALPRAKNRRDGKYGHEFV